MKKFFLPLIIPVLTSKKIQKMSDLQQNDEHFMNKLQEIVPELRKEIESNMRNRLSMQLQKAKEKKRVEMNTQYQNKIRLQIEESNQHLKVSLAGMMERMEKIKRELNNHKPKRLTREDEEEIIEQTVEQVLGDQTMLREVRQRLRPKVEARVRADLDKEMEEGVEMMRREMIQKMNEDRQIWTEERINCWKRQSQLQLSELAAEHCELSTKKQNMETVFNGKKMEKRQAEKRWEAVVEKNSKIAELKAELKRLKQMR